MQRTTVEELLEHLDVFERQLRYLAEGRQHVSQDREGKPLVGQCGGLGLCTKCGLLRRADRIRDLTAGGLEILIGEAKLSSGGSVGIGVSQVREALSTLRDAEPEALLEAVDGPPKGQATLL